LNSNISVADAFSLLKSVVKSGENGTYLEKLEKRMNQQEELKKIELVGPRLKKLSSLSMPPRVRIKISSTAKE
jgi:ppGpp synthetase/RelA/SpoT-type nucleotidyltranferase